MATLTAFVRLCFLAVWMLVVASARVLLRNPTLPGWRWRHEYLFGVARRFAWSERQRPPAAFRGVLGGPPDGARTFVSLQRGSLGGCPAETHVPPGWTAADPTVLYLHGGGYAICSPRTHRHLVGQLALASGARCVALDYRLAPEHPHPAAIDDALAAWDELVAAGHEPAELVVVGDSAGGGLALLLALALRDRGSPLPGGLALMSPWCDLAMEGPSIDSSAGVDYLPRQLLEGFAAAFVGDADPRSPSVSGLRADLAGLPPLYVQVGSAEALAWEGTELVRRAQAVGIPAELEVGEDMVHVWAAFAPLLSESRAAVRRLAAFVRRASGRGGDPAGASGGGVRGRAIGPQWPGFAGVGASGQRAATVRGARFLPSMAGMYDSRPREAGQGSGHEPGIGEVGDG